MIGSCFFTFPCRLRSHVTRVEERSIQLPCNDRGEGNRDNGGAGLRLKLVTTVSFSVLCSALHMAYAVVT